MNGTPLLPVELQLIACGTLAAFFAWVVRLVRFKRLSLRDSLLWILSTLTVFILAAFPASLRWLARAMAVEVPANALFALAIFYLTLNVLGLTIAQSKDATYVRRLTQECALLRQELEVLSAEIKRDAITRGGAKGRAAS
jgi:hypothetical protein